MIRQTWLRDLLKEYGRQVRPNVIDLRFVLQAAGIASAGLATRRHGDDPHKLELADMSAIVDAFHIAHNPKTGKAYSDPYRRQLLGHWRRFLDRP